MVNFSDRRLPLGDAVIVSQNGQEVDLAALALTKLASAALCERFACPSVRLSVWPSIISETVRDIEILSSEVYHAVRDIEILSSGVYHMSSMDVLALCSKWVWLVEVGVVLDISETVKDIEILSSGVHHMSSMDVLALCSKWVWLVEVGVVLAISETVKDIEILFSGVHYTIRLKLLFYICTCNSLLFLSKVAGLEEFLQAYRIETAKTCKSW
ncbi:hypothetical protein Fcan01_27406 [Folsomia candida]|uniref:Uncharacterized protein n=1 Tax=Folsomia candida TaxID=158441 RepID=A0A226CWW4_FOLCA|nr:hypothetical protein Fcan01_27406 [Folsomia candida]